MPWRAVAAWWQLSKGQRDGGGLNPLSAPPLLGKCRMLSQGDLNIAETATLSIEFNCSLKKGLRKVRTHPRGGAKRSLRPP